MPPLTALEAAPSVPWAAISPPPLRSATKPEASAFCGSRTPLGCHLAARALPTLETASPSKAYGGRVLTPFLRRRLALLGLARRNVHDRLGELVGVAGAFLSAKLARPGGAALALKSLKGLVVDRWRLSRVRS